MYETYYVIRFIYFYIDIIRIVSKLVIKFG